MTVLNVGPEPVPLVADRDGVVRVGSTRVTLDAVVVAFRAGATAEQIARQYPSAELADVYAVLTYYLRHRLLVEEYLVERAAATERVRSANERRFEPTGVRERLTTRRPVRESA